MEKFRPHFTILDAPSILGLHPCGVENLPQALKAAGLMTSLNAKYAGRVEPLPYDPGRDKETLLLNPKGIREYSLQLERKVSELLRNELFPLVLGGDCSILIGTLLALRRTKKKFGLFFIDGHADFYQPEASLTGEVADMELALVSGRGPDILANIGGLKPLVRDQDVVVFGYRDAEQSAGYGSQDVRDTDMCVFDLSKIREVTIAKAASMAARRLLKQKLDGFWIHLDADVLDDEIMPAVDYRLDGGLSFCELSDLISILFRSGCPVVGMTITIFNPNMDLDGSTARKFVSSLIIGLS
jgi:arginase